MENLKPSRSYESMQIDLEKNPIYLKQNINVDNYYYTKDNVTKKISNVILNIIKLNNELIFEFISKGIK